MRTYRKITISPEEKLVLSIPEVAARLSVCNDTVRALIRSGAIPHFRIGHRILIKRADIEVWVTQIADKEIKPVDYGWLKDRADRVERPIGTERKQDEESTFA
jgi:excisionase family DNA binding protein